MNLGGFLVDWGMPESRKKKLQQGIAGDPKEGDAILKRMLQMKPKPHKEMVKKRPKSDARSTGSKDRR